MRAYGKPKGKKAGIPWNARWEFPKLLQDEDLRASLGLFQSLTETLTLSEDAASVGEKKTTTT